MEIIQNETHKKGLLGELEFTLHFIETGWTVYKPLNQSSRIDLLIQKHDKFKRVQVKYCTPYKGCLRIELEHPKRKTKPYTREDIDFIGAFDSKNKKFYLVPIEDILPRKEIWIRVEPSKKAQDKNINKADKYLF